jgi:type I site-specific restriction-modification system R (restriction) subunit
MVAFYAGRIILHPRMANPTIVVITDRNDLDDQLFGTFARCRDLLRQAPVQAADRADLRAKLSVAGGGVVFTTIQKFLPGEPPERSAEKVIALPSAGQARSPTPPQAGSGDAAISPPSTEVCEEIASPRPAGPRPGPAIPMRRASPRTMKVTVIARRPQADEAISSNDNEIASSSGSPSALRTPRNDTGGGETFETPTEANAGGSREKGDRNPVLSERRNIVVIADEAHRSQYDFIDGYARHMHDALPKASFIGFTGTPIELPTRTPARCSASTSASTTSSARWRTGRRCRSTTRGAWRSWSSPSRSGRRSIPSSRRRPRARRSSARSSSRRSGHSSSQ